MSDNGHFVLFANYYSLVVEITRYISSHTTRAKLVVELSTL